VFFDEVLTPHCYREGCQGVAALLLFLLTRIDDCWEAVESCEHHRHTHLLFDLPCNDDRESVG